MDVLQVLARTGHVQSVQHVTTRVDGSWECKVSFVNCITGATVHRWGAHASTRADAQALAAKQCLPYITRHVLLPCTPVGNLGPPVSTPASCA